MVDICQKKNFLDTLKKVKTVIFGKLPAHRSSFQSGRKTIVKINLCGEKRNQHPYLRTHLTIFSHALGLSTPYTYLTHRHHKRKTILRS